MHPMKKLKFMQQRREHGLTHNEIGKEFGMSRQHAGRLLATTFSPEKNMIKDPSPKNFDGQDF